MGKHPPLKFDKGPLTTASIGEAWRLAHGRTQEDGLRFARELESSHPEIVDYSKVDVGAVLRSVAEPAQLWARASKFRETRLKARGKKREMKRRAAPKTPRKPKQPEPTKQPKARRDPGQPMTLEEYREREAAGVKAKLKTRAGGRAAGVYRNQGERPLRG